MLHVRPCTHMYTCIYVMVIAWVVGVYWNIMPNTPRSNHSITTYFIPRKNSTTKENNYYVLVKTVTKAGM